MSHFFPTLKKILVNGSIVTLVFLFAFFVATQALMHKINNYELNKSLLFLTVQKEKFDISTTVAGRIEEIRVREGSVVKAGDVVARLKDEGRDLKIEALRVVARDNLSARTELQLLLAQEEAYDIRASRDGVVEQIKAAKGTSIVEGTPLMSVYADEGLDLVGAIRADQYQLIDKHRSVTIFNPRLGQAFTATFSGISGIREEVLPDGTRVPQTDAEEEMYEIRFVLNEKEEGNTFIDGERIEILSENVAVEELKPLYRLARLWNSLILGTDFESLKQYNESTPTAQ